MQVINRTGLIRIIILLITGFFSFSLAAAQSEMEETENPETMDSKMRHGKLPNGLTYYIKPLSQLQDKVNLLFYVKAGLNQEEEDQMDLSHAVEHLAFGASSNFPLGVSNNVELLNKMNMSDRDIAGTTGFSSTRYIFNAPPNHPEAINLGLQWFKDIATGLKLNDADIEKERGVLRQEFIYGDSDVANVQLKLISKLFPCRKDYTNFFSHNQTFTPSSLRQFYQQWYRPDLMSVVIVGNIKNPDAMVRQISKEFSDIGSQQKVLKNKDCDRMYYNRPPQFVRVERKPDTLNPYTSGTVEINYFIRQPAFQKARSTKEGIKQLLALQLLIQIIDDRFEEMAKTYNSSYKASCIDPSAHESLPQAIKISITSKNNSEKRASQETFKFLHQLEKFGVTQQEWDKVKKAWIKVVGNSSPSNSQYWLKEIGKNFEEGEILFPEKQRYLKNWLYQLTVEDFNRMIPSFLSNEPDDIGIIAPTGHKALKLTNNEIRLWLRGAYNLPIKPYVVPQIPNTLMDPLMRAKLSIKAFKNKGVTEFGARELILENGVKVVLMAFKPTPGIYDDRIMVTAINPNGAYNFLRKDFYSAINAADIICNTGIGNFDKFTIERYVSESGIEHIRPYISYKESGINGISKLDGLENMLELVFLYFKDPKITETAFEDWKNNQNFQYQNPSYNLSSTDFKNTIKALTMDNYLPLVLGGRQLSGSKANKGLNDINLNKAYNIYQELFGNAQNFTFLISGDFDMDSVIPLVQKYLGNLTSQNISKISSLEKNETSLISGPIFYKFISPGYDMKSIHYALTFIKPLDTNEDWRDHIKTEILSGMTHQLSQGLRYDQGISLYNFGVYGDFNKDLQRSEIIFNIQCESDELEIIRQECKKIIEDIKKGRVNSDVFEQAIKRSLNLFNKSNLDLHRNMKKRLYEHYRYQESWIDSTEIVNYIKTLKIEDIVKYSQEIYIEELQYEFVMGNEI